MQDRQIRDADIRSFWKAGGVALGGWLNVPSPVVAELMAHAGWDVLTIDLQHGLIDYQIAVVMLQAMTGTGVVPFARVPWNEPGIIGKMLDAGCVGVIAPMISTCQDAERLVGACRYPPLGYRSIGPMRAALVYGADYVDRAEAYAVAIALIETAQAVERIKEIVNTPGLDAILIGPGDLSRSLIGASRPALSHPTMAGAIDKIFDAAGRAGRVVGIYTHSVEDALTMAGKGAQFLPVLSDSRLLQAAARDTVQHMRDGINRRVVL